MHNIEKRPFHKGEYAGYSNGRVFTIRRSTSSFGNWYAVQENDVPGRPARNAPHIYAMRLRDMSAKLEALPNPFAVR